MLLAERPADFRRERARTVRFAWHMRRNGEAVADPALRGQFENLAIAGRELDQVRQPTLVSWLARCTGSDGPS
jgi:hypothetical protein